jgi:hypothetical protein
MMPLNKLTLGWIFRPGFGTVGGPGTWKTPRWTLDFIIDGRSLFQVLDVAAQDGIGALGWSGSPAAEADLVRGLTPDHTTANGGERPSIYVCAECGDLSCGAHTIQVLRKESTIVWQDFRFENDYDPSMTRLIELGPFVFDADRYAAALASPPPLPTTP